MDQQRQQQKSKEQEKLENIRENFHQQYRQQYMNNLLAQNRALLIQAVQPQAIDSIGLQQKDLKSIIGDKKVSLQSRLREIKEVQNFISSSEKLSMDERKEVQRVCIELLSQRLFRYDPQFIHSLLILQQMTADEINGSILTCYICLFVKYPNLLTIVTSLERWLQKYQGLQQLFQTACQIKIDEVQGTLVQIICKQENVQNYKGRLEMLRVMITYIGNKELLEALFLLEMSNLLEICIETFWKEVYSIVLSLLDNLNFTQYKNIEKIIKKLRELLKPSKIEILNQTILNFSYRLNNNKCKDKSVKET